MGLVLRRSQDRETVIVSNYLHAPRVFKRAIMSRYDRRLTAVWSTDLDEEKPNTEWSWVPDYAIWSTGSRMARHVTALSGNYGSEKCTMTSSGLLQITVIADRHAIRYFLMAGWLSRRSWPFDTDEVERRWDYRFSRTIKVGETWFDAS